MNRPSPFTESQSIAMTAALRLPSRATADRVKQRSAMQKYPVEAWAAFAASTQLQGMHDKQTAYMRRLAFGYVALNWLEEKPGNQIALAVVLSQSLQNTDPKIARAAALGMADALTEDRAQVRHLVDKYDKIATLQLWHTLCQTAVEAAAYDKPKIDLVKVALETMVARYNEAGTPAPDDHAPDRPAPRSASHLRLVT